MFEEFSLAHFENPPSPNVLVNEFMRLARLGFIDSTRGKGSTGGMGWIVRDAVVRYREEIGTFRGHEWRRCAERVGLEVVVIDLGPLTPAAIVHGTLFISSKLPPRLRALWAYHEIGHHLLHVGNYRFWQSLPGGESLTKKYERQAWQFAFLFPRWQEP